MQNPLRDTVFQNGYILYEARAVTQRQVCVCVCEWASERVRTRSSHPQWGGSDQ
jgi:hypothetical protein